MTGPEARRRLALGLPVAVLVAAALGLAAVPIAYAHPFFDDFHRGGEAVRAAGILASFRDEYLHWTGRWAALAIEYADGASDTFAGYRAVLAVGNAAVAASLMFAASAVLRLRTATAVVVGAFAFVLLWSGAASVGESHYWVTGLVENRLALAAGLAVVAALCREGGGTGATAGLAAAAFAVEGLHELWGAMLLAALALGAVVAHRLRHPRRRAWAVVAAAAAAGLAVTALAPGNAAREAAEAGRPVTQHDQFELLLLAGSQAKRALADWLLRPALPLALTGAYLLVRSVSAVPSWAERRFPWFRVLLGAWLVLLAAGFVVTSYAIGRRMPLRTLDGLHFVFVIGALLLAMLAALRATERAGAPRPRLAVPGAACWGLAVAFLLHIGNGWMVIEDWRSGRLEAFDQARTARVATIAEARREGRTSVEVPAIEPYPATFSPFDLTDLPGANVNKTVARFYGLAEIRAVRR